MRLDKVIEDCCKTSRGMTKQLLKSKRVTIDDQVELNGRRNVDSQLHRIQIDGKQYLETEHVYYLLNKPPGIVTAVKDDSKSTVLDLIEPIDRRSNLYPVGRLDRDTEGLVFLTDNGPLGYELMQAKYAVPKVYEALVNESVTLEDVEAFQKGIIFADGKVCQPAQLEIITQMENENLTRLMIVEGKFHQVKKMFLSRGKKVRHLKRISLGPLVLDRALSVGSYRQLTGTELFSLKTFFH